MMLPLSRSIKAVLFDFDGTLTRPGAIDFQAIRRAIGCPPEETILEFIAGLPSGREQDAARAELDRLELTAAGRAEPNAGAEELVRALRRQGLKLAVLSRNSHRAIERALVNFPTLRPEHFDFIGARELPTAPKPSPEGILHAAEVVGVNPAEMLVVGDFIFDVQAGNAAGSVTVFLTNGDGRECAESDHNISHLRQVRDLLGLPD